MIIRSDDQRSINQLKPSVTSWIEEMIRRGRVSAASTGSATGGGGGGGGGGDGTIPSHSLDSHTGSLTWGRVNKTGSSIADLANHNHSVLAGLTSSDDHPQYMHISTPRTVSAVHTFNPPSAGPGFALGDNATGRKIPGLNADQLDGLDESIFMRRVATSDLDMNGFLLDSPNADTQHLLGRAALGFMGITSYAGFAARGFANTTGYAIVQNAGDGSVHVNRPAAANLYFKKDNAAQMYLSDNLVFSSPVGLQSESYASQTTGWRMTYGGQLDTRYIYTDEMHAKAFIADLEFALAGGQIICKSVAPLASAFTVPAYSATASLVIESFAGFPNAYVFQNGDTIGIRINSRSAGTATVPGSLTIAWVFGTVVSASIDTTNKRQTWTFTRLSSSTINGFAAGGTASASAVIDAGAIVLDFGVSGNGYYEVSAIDGQLGANSPYMQIVTWDTHPIYDRHVRSRYGNLAGLPITDYGMVMGSDVSAAATTTFDFRASNGQARFGALGANLANILFVPASGAIQLRVNTQLYAQLANNGLRLYDGNGNATIVLENTGDSYFAYLMTIGTSGELRQGTGALGTDFAGFRLRNVSGMGRFSLYDADVENLLLDNLGLDMLQDDQLIAVKARSVSWWPSLASRTGNPTGMMTHFQNSSSFENTTLIRSRGITTGHEAIIKLEAIPQSGTTRTLSLDTYGSLLSNANIGGTWAALTPATGWANEGSGLATLAVKKFGDMLVLKGRVTYSSGGTATLVNLPTGYRPSEDLTIICWVSVGGVMVLREVRIRDNGDVGAAGWTPASGDKISLNEVFFL